MSNLRRRQRQKREDAIIEAAKQLIGEKGYRNTSIEEISGKAEVGPATVYNYFSSKSGLFISIFAREVEALIEKCQKVIGSPPESGEEAVYTLGEACLTHFTEKHSKQLMREVFVAALVEQLSVRKEIIMLDYRMMDQCVELLEIIKSRGQIRSDLETADVAFVVYSLIMTDMLSFFVDDDMSIQDCRVALKHHVRLLFRGFAP